jgi:hypothetical protein
MMNGPAANPTPPTTASLSPGTTPPSCSISATPPRQVPIAPAVSAWILLARLC